MAAEETNTPLDAIWSRKAEAPETAPAATPATEPAPASPVAPAAADAKPNENKPAEKQGDTEATPAAQQETDDLDAVAVPERPRDAQGRWVPLDVARAERKKRQEIGDKLGTTERELAEVKGRLSAFSQITPPQAAKPTAPTPPTPEQLADEFYADPVGFIQKQEQAAQARAHDEFMRRSMRAAAKRHNDFAEAIQVFDEAAKHNPLLLQQAHAEDDPGEFAYTVAQTYKRATQYGGSLEEMEAKIREDERKKARAEFEAERAKEAKAAALSAATQAPKTIAGAHGTGAESDTFAGPTPLDQIWGRRTG